MEILTPESAAFFSSCFISLIVIIDPFALVPIYQGLTENDPISEKRKIRNKAVLIATCILLSFSIFGMQIFDLFGISIAAFKIAGGILLLRMGLGQLQADRSRISDEEEEEGQNRDDISVFPLATPMLSGPGAISSVILQAGKAQSITQNSLVILSIICAMICSWTILKLGPRLLDFTGRTGLNILTRVMGVMLTAIAIQFILEGVSAYYFDVFAKS